jgi:hypothetical protein
MYLNFSVLKLRGWSPWEDVILLVKASQVLRLVIDTFMLYLQLYTWFMPCDMIKYVLSSDLTNAEKSHNLSVIICSAVMREWSLIRFNATFWECATFFLSVWQQCVLVHSFFSNLVYIICIFLLPANWNTVQIEIFQQTLFLFAL